MKLIDEVIIDAKAGDGGNGLVAWRREKFIPMGGPFGGDGGDGGDVILLASDDVHSLLDFRFMPRLEAKNGEKGRTKNQYGARGEDVIAKVPVGTQAFNEEDGSLIADLTKPGMQAIVCKGGSGGFGNTRFQSATLQAPDFAKPGLPGEAKRLKLSLKLMADVGLLGYPNAGKSTLLSAVSAAKPKIADYPFTTLNPKLGVAQTSDGHSFVIADIPGLIEGASEGAGLGIRFLKHLERVQVLCHLVEPFPTYFGGSDQIEHDLDDPDLLIKRYETIRQELLNFNEDFVDLPEIVVVSKGDLIPEEMPESLARFRRYLEEKQIFYMVISSVTQNQLNPLLFALWDAIARQKKVRGLGLEKSTLE